MDNLARYSYFQESVILDFWSDNLLRDIVVLVDNIWQHPDEMYTNLDDLHPVSLRFESCRAFRMENADVDFSEHPEEADWGLSEFSVLRYLQLEDGLQRYTFEWEDARKLEITCAHLLIEEIEVTPELQSRYRYPKLNAKAV